MIEVRAFCRQEDATDMQGRDVTKYSYSGIVLEFKFEGFSLSSSVSILCCFKLLLRHIPDAKLVLFSSTTYS